MIKIVMPIRKERRPCPQRSFALKSRFFHAGFPDPRMPALEEKVKLLVGKGMHLPGVETGGPVIGQAKDRVPRDIKQSASFRLEKTLVVEQVHKAVAPQLAINELQTRKKG
jgi:hypothetical protein